MFNPTYIASSYANNVDRVQSATLRIKSATATQWTTIRNLSAVETSLVGGGELATAGMKTNLIFSSSEYALGIQSGVAGKLC